MADYEITFIQADAALPPQQRIIAVGGHWPLPWSMPLAEAVRRINAGEDRFYLQRVRGLNIFMVVACDAAGHVYLKAPGEGAMPRMLLDLPIAA